MIREIEYLESDNPFQRKIEFLENDKVLGTIVYSLIYDRIEVDDVFVDEGERNKGIATKLMSYLVYLAIDKHVINMTLEVRISNDIAIHLYKKYGFREVALRHKYYNGEDGILMEKQVM